MLHTFDVRKDFGVSYAARVVSAHRIPDAFCNYAENVCENRRTPRPRMYPRAKLHLYGKYEARPGRKMGHYTCLATAPSKVRVEELVLYLSLIRLPAK